MAVANTRVVNGINTRVLHNKDYVEVAERVRILHELRKEGSIKEFEMVESSPYEIAGQPYWRVSARIDGKLYIGNAEIKLDAPKNTPDGTNPICCAETSAFGRMLAFAGLGTVESIASYEEVMRGQPFVAVIEQSQNKVVEAGNIRHLQASTTRPGAPELANGHAPQSTATTEAKGQPAPVQAQLSPLGKAIIAAKECGFITGATSDERAASWQEQLNQIFDGHVPSEADLKQPANLARINGAIEAHRRHVAERKATSGK